MMPIWRRSWLIQLLGAGVGIAAGFALGWLYSPGPTPWLEWRWLSADYETGAHRIVLVGQYQVRKPCRGLVLWRTEATATDGQIAAYGPTEQPPDLTPGTHQYLGEIALLSEILPDGWTTRVIVTCAGDSDVKTPTVASSAAIVAIQGADRRSETPPAR